MRSLEDPWECPQWILTGYPLSTDRQEKQCDGTKGSCFLENRSRLENEAQNVMQLGITKKHTADDESWKNTDSHRLSGLSAATVFVTLAKLLKHGEV